MLPSPLVIVSEPDGCLKINTRYDRCHASITGWWCLRGCSIKQNKIVRNLSRYTVANRTISLYHGMFRGRKIIIIIIVGGCLRCCFQYFNTFTQSTKKFPREWHLAYRIEQSYEPCTDSYESRDGIYFESIIILSKWEFRIMLFHMDYKNIKKETDCEPASLHGPEITLVAIYGRLKKQ